jgi:hypothetical protein
MSERNTRHRYAADNSGGAHLSADEMYRYVLWRVIAGSSLRGDHALWVMLNPSTADAIDDDPTIRRVRGFSEHWGCDSFSVVNLFAYRATDPIYLKVAQNVVGRDNDATIAKEAKWADLIILAWGTRSPFAARAIAVEGLLRPFHKRCFTLGRTLRGHPKHPLYLPKATELERAWPKSDKP